MKILLTLIVRFCLRLAFDNSHINNNRFLYEVLKGFDDILLATIKGAADTVKSVNQVRSVEASKLFVEMSGKDPLFSAPKVRVRRGE